MSTENRTPAPYADPESNLLYNMLFCDDLEAFRPRGTEPRHGWHRTLFGRNTAPAEVTALAADESAESRVRALAYLWLRSRGEPVPPRVLLGVVVEVPLEEGLDALAAYADRRVRLLHHGGTKVFVEDGAPAAGDLAEEMVRASNAVVARIGSWGQARLDPPAPGICRLSFVASDGLYFGQGQFAAMSQDPMAGPVLQAATRLLDVLASMTSPS